MIEDLPAFLPTIIAVISLSLLPFLVVMGTAFTKITIVLLLLRNAMGVQQAPSGLVINAIALTLTAFIMYPVGNSILVTLQAEGVGLKDWESSVRTYEIVSDAFVTYLSKFTSEREMDFIMVAATRLWPEELHSHIHEKNLFLCCLHMSHPKSPAPFRSDSYCFYPLLSSTWSCQM
jgi:type III secretion protein R